MTELCSSALATSVKANRIFRVVPVTEMSSVEYFYLSTLFDITRIEALMCSQSLLVGGHQLADVSSKLRNTFFSPYKGPNVILGVVVFVQS